MDHLQKIKLKNEIGMVPTVVSLMLKLVYFIFRKEM